MVCVVFKSYSSRTHRIWADIYNQRGCRPSWLLSASPSKSEKNNCFSKFSNNSKLISLGETSANRDIFFTDDATRNVFPTSTRNLPSVFPYLVKLNDNGSYDGLREPIRKLENHYHELKIYKHLIIMSFSNHRLKRCREPKEKVSEKRNCLKDWFQDLLINNCLLVCLIKLIIDWLIVIRILYNHTCLFASIYSGIMFIRRQVPLSMMNAWHLIMLLWSISVSVPLHEESSLVYVVTSSSFAKS